MDICDHMNTVLYLNIIHVLYTFGGYGVQITMSFKSIYILIQIWIYSFDPCIHSFTQFYFDSQMKPKIVIMEL